MAAASSAGRTLSGRLQPSDGRPFTASVVADDAVVAVDVPPRGGATLLSAPKRSQNVWVRLTPGSVSVSWAGQRPSPGQNPSQP